MKLAEVVKTHGGNSAFVPKSIIARELQMDQTSSNFSQVVASAKTYGLVEGHLELRLTPVACDYFFPLSEDARHSAELEFLSAPPAFQHLLERYDGSRLPSTSIINNELGRNCGVPDTWRTRATSFFLGAAQDLGVIDGGNFLRYAAAKHSAGNYTPQGTTEGLEPVVTENVPLAVAVGRMNAPPIRGTIETTRPEPQSWSPTAADFMPEVRGQNVWVYRDTEGGTVRLETPEKMSKALWDRLKAYLEILKPETQAKEEQMVVSPERAG